MNVGVVNSVRPSFKGIKTEEDFQNLSKSIKTLNDNIPKSSVSENDKKSDKKNILEIGMAVAAAALVTYAFGSAVAGKVNEIFPKFASELEGALKNGYEVSKGGVDKVLQSENPVVQKIGNFAKKGIEFAKGIYKNNIKGAKGTAEDAFTRMAGLGFMVGGTKKIITADGNQDGVADITQKSQNAYKAALDNLGAVETIAKILA